MNRTANDPDDLLSLDAAKRIDHTCADYERAWQSGSRPPIEGYVCEAESAERLSLLRQLLLLDIDYRNRVGEGPTPDEYYARFPEHVELIDGVFRAWSCAASANGRASVPHESRSVGATSPRSAERALRIRCPHCGNRIQLVAHELGEVTCVNCGSSFRLTNQPGSSSSREAIPQWIGRFQILERLGQGAFGGVYKAYDSELDLTVAIKSPRSGFFVGKEEEERFLREARSAARLKHPHIVRVHDVIYEADVPYIVSEYIEGETLAELLDRGRLTFRETAVLIAQTADALEYAHREKVIHRDIKPSNILVDSSGQPHLTDFGLARRDEGEITVTLDGQLLGTPAYMSPEQARGDQAQVDSRSDVYSLGVVLYELLTGELPFRGNRRMLLHQLLHDEPRPPRSLNHLVPRDLETICLKAMAKERQRRFQTANELADDLRRWLGGEPIQARPVGRIERMARWCGRKPLVATLSAAIVLVLLMGSVASSILGLAAHRETEKAIQARDDAQRSADNATRLANERAKLLEQESNARKRSEMNLYLLRIRQAEQEWRDNNLGRAEELLDACPKELRHWEWYYLKRLCHPELFAFKRFPETKDVAEMERNLESIVELLLFEQTPVVFSPNSNWIATSAWDRDGIRQQNPNAPCHVKILDASTGETNVTLKGHTAAVNGLAFSPDSRQIASAGFDKTVRTWDVETGQELRSMQGHTGRVTDVVFSPNGKWLASLGRKDNRHNTGWHLKIWDLETGQEARGFEAGSTAFDVMRITFSPDSKQIAAFAANHADVIEIPSIVRLFNRDKHNGLLIAWDLNTGDETILVKQSVRLDKRWFPCVRLFYSEDGTRIITVNGRFCSEWEAKTGRELSNVVLETRAQTDRTSTVLDVAIHPNCSLLASVSDDGTLRLWDLGEGAVVFEITNKPGLGEIIGRLALCPDGRWIAAIRASGDAEEIQRWDAETGKELQTIRGLPYGTCDLIVSPDGGRIAAAGLDGAVKVWEVHDGDPLFAHKTIGAFDSVVNLPQGAQVRGSDGRRSGLALWDATAEKRIIELSEFPGSVALGPNGVFLVAFDDTVLVAAPGSQIRDIKRVQGVNGLAFSPDGRHVALDRKSSNLSRSIEVWELETGTRLLSTEGYGSIFNPDGRSITFRKASGAITVWNLIKRQEMLTLDGSGDDRIPSWLLQGHRFGGVAFSPDGRRIVSESANGHLRMWDTATGRELLKLPAIDVDLSGPVFSPDGRRIIAGSTMWDAGEDFSVLQ